MGIGITRRTPVAPGKFRVAHFVLDPRVGGPHVFLATLQATLAGQMESIVATAGQGPITDEALLNLRRYGRLLYPIEIVLNGVLIAWRFRLGRRSRDGIALFHVHGAANLAPLLGAAIARFPVVWHLHEVLPELKPLAQLGGRLLACVRSAKATVLPAAPAALGLPAMEWIPCPVDSAFWNPDCAAATDWVTTGKRLITVANLNPVKGIDVVIEALGRVPGPWHLKVVGAPLESHTAYRERLEGLAQRVSGDGAERIVEFVGWQSPESVRSLLRSADLFVFASASETGPIALFEAMAMEKACVTTEVGAVSEVLPPAQRRFVCPVNDAGAVAHAIREALTLTSAQRAGLGRENRRSIQRLRDPVGIGSRMLDTYRRLLEDRA